MQNFLPETEYNVYHNLIMELQQVRKCGLITLLQFGEYDIHVYFATTVQHIKIDKVAKYVRNRYKLYVESDPFVRRIIICDAYSLNCP